jgi:GT2 family glycosyltransferase
VRLDAHGAMSPTPDISVVIPTYKGANRISAVLLALGNQTLDSERFEVLVADDCSPDDTTAIVEELAPRVPYRLRVLHAPVNQGPAAARNDAWRAAEAPLVAFLDDDCDPAPGWLEAGISAFTEQPKAGVIQGRTHAPEGVSVWGLTDWYIWRIVEQASPYFEGCNLFFRREVLEVTGGFDEELRWYGEDTAAGWRALEAGWEQGFAPDASVTHTVERRGWRWFIRNQYTERKNLAVVAAQHPGFREAAFWRPWSYSREDAAFVAAVAGVAAGVRFRPALLLALPYLWWQRPSIRHLSFFRLCLQVPVVDAARAAGALRGSLAQGKVMI